MADNDDKKTYNRTPMSASTRPAPQAAPVRTPEQLREMQALLKVSGAYNGKVSGDANDPAKAAIEKFQKANGLDPAKSSPDETLAKMREAVKNDPQAVARMKTLSGTPDQDNTYAIQYGLRAKGAMIVPNGRTTIDGKLDAQTATVLQGVEKAQLAAAQPATPTTTPTPAATATAGATPAPVPLVDLGTSPAAPQMGILQMIILMIAQALGMNLTTLQQAGAQNRPPAVVSTAAPAAPVTARPPTPQPAPAPTAPTPAATPATATPVVAESEQAHCDRLGYSQQQYEKLKSDQQKWQADYDAGRPHKRLSPFKMADEADKLMQKEVGLEGNDAKWAALKKENQAWQTAKDKDEPHAKISPLQQALFAATNRPEPSAAPALAESRPMATPVDYRPVPVRPAARENFNANANVDLNVVSQMMQARAEYRNSGLAPQLAAQEVNNSRLDFLINQQGMDPRNAGSLVKAESRAADIQERYQATQGRQNDRQMQQAIRQAEQMDRREAAAQNRANREFGRDLGALAGGASVLTGANGRQAGAARDIGRVLPSILGGLGLGGSAPASPSQSRAFGNDMGTAARGLSILGGATGREATAMRDLVGAGTNILSRTGIIGGADQSQYRVITYPPQSQRGDYVPQPRIDQNPFSYDGGDLQRRMKVATDDGVTPDQRYKIIKDYEASRNGPAAAVPDAPVGKQRQDMMFPGG